MSMELALEQLTPERWQKALAVLNGEEGTSVSVRAAANAAGVPTAFVKLWVRRSREKHLEDDSWVHDIADQFDASALEQAGILEDKLFDHAVNGVPTPIVSKGEHIGDVRKHSGKLTMDMLKARDDRYRTRQETTVKLTMDDEDVQMRFIAMMRLRAAQLEAIEGTYEEVGAPVVGARRLQDLKSGAEEAPDPDEMFEG